MSLLFAQESHRLVPWTPLFVKDRYNPSSSTRFAVARTMTFVKPKPPTVQKLAFLESSRGEVLLNAAAPVLYGPQVEAALYAMSQFQSPLVDGFQRGFFLGDQAGVGKTRLACLLIKNLFVTIPQEQKALYVSCSSGSLFLNLQKELDIICGHREIKVFKYKCEEKKDEAKFCKKKNIDKRNDKKIDKSNLPQSKGVMFTTYSALRGKSGNLTNLFEISKWLSRNFAGIIIFDEAHNAKNSRTEQGKVVKWLQLFCPLAKILYMSATVGTEPENLHYMLRLGLWGTNAPFGTYEEFQSKLEASSINGLEMISAYLHGKGRYLARQLKVADLEFKTLLINLDEKTAGIYDLSVQILQTIYMFIKVALEPRDSRKLLQIYWGTHQRFLESLIHTIKAKGLAAILRDYPNEKYAYVISLKDTGNEKFLKMNPKLKRTEEYSTCREILRCLWSQVLEHCRGVHSVEKDQITSALKQLYPLLGKNPLDTIVETFGGHKNVTEITGRKWHQVKCPPKEVLFGGEAFLANYDEAKLSLGGPEDEEMFQNGTKKVAIISVKGSTGISLHADAKYIRYSQLGRTASPAFSPLPRLHILFQTTWNPEHGMQQLGRSCRANQISVPKYFICSTNIPGEKRFQQSFISRVAKLGAICHSERNTGNEVTKAFQDCFTESPAIANHTVKLLSNKISAADDGVFSADFRKNVEQVGLLEPNKANMHKTFDVFFNRILGMTLKCQRIILEEFKRIYSEEMVKAKTNGQIVPETKEISNRWIVTLCSVEHTFGFGTEIETAVVKLKADRGVNFGNLQNMVDSLKQVNPKKHEIYFKKGNEIICAFEYKGDAEVYNYKVYSPWNCVFRTMLAETLESWTILSCKSDIKEIKETWNAMYKAGESEDTCLHTFTGRICTIGYEKCRLEQSGSRKFTFYALNGALLSVFFELQQLYSSKKILMETLRVRVFTDKLDRDGTKMIVAFIPRNLLHQVSILLRKKYGEAIESDTSDESESDASDTSDCDDEVFDDQNSCNEEQNEDQNHDKCYSSDEKTDEGFPELEPLARAHGIVDIFEKWLTVNTKPSETLPEKILDDNIHHCYMNTEEIQDGEDDSSSVETGSDSSSNSSEEESDDGSSSNESESNDSSSSSEVESNDSSSSSEAESDDDEPDEKKARTNYY